ANRLFGPDSVYYVDPQLTEYLRGDKGIEEVKQLSGHDEIVKHVAASSLILVPIHYVEHWTLAVFLPESKQYLYLDPLYKLDRTSQDNGLDIVSLIVFWWASVGATDDVHWERLRVRSREQENRYDCGAFVCASARLLALGYDMSDTDPLPYSQGDILSFRHHMARELLAGAICGRGIPGNDFRLMRRYIAQYTPAQEMLCDVSALGRKMFMRSLVSDEAPRVTSPKLVDESVDEKGKPKKTSKARKGKAGKKGTKKA
ncbi:Smt3-specific protease, partial [Ascosphaera atra]